VKTLTFSSTPTTIVRYLGGSLAAFVLCATASAQTVVVDASNGSPNGTTTFNTLHDAVASFASGTGTNAGNPAANVINVAPGTPVVDKVNADVEHPTTPMTILGDLTIQGDGGLAIMAGQPLENGEQVIRVTDTPTNPPLRPSFAWRQPGTLTLKNIAFIPTDPIMRGLVAIKAPNSSDDPVVNVENCVFTANNGSNQPVTTTGKDDPNLTDPGVIALAAGGDALFALSVPARGDLTVNVTNSVFASFALPHATSDGIISFLNGTAGDYISSFLNVNEGCVFANSGRGIQNPYGGIVNVAGTAVNPVVFRNMTGASVIFNYSDAAIQPTACNVNFARFYNNNGIAVAELLSRAFINNISNTVIAESPNADGINIQANGALPPNGEATNTITIDNVTIHNAGVGGTPGAIYIAAANNRNVNITNSTFTGPGKNGIVNNSAGIVNVSESTLSLNGPNALLAATAGSGTVNLDTSVDHIQVDYVNMNDPFSPDFFKVAGSDVRDWSVY